MDQKLEDIDDRLHCARDQKPAKLKVCVKNIVRNPRNSIDGEMGGSSRTFYVDEVTERFMSTNNRWKSQSRRCKHFSCVVLFVLSIIKITTYTGTRLLYDNAWPIILSSPSKCFAFQPACKRFHARRVFCDTGTVGRLFDNTRICDMQEETILAQVIRCRLAAGQFNKSFCNQSILLIIHKPRQYESDFLEHTAVLVLTCKSASTLRKDSLLSPLASKRIVQQCRVVVGKSYYLVTKTQVWLRASLLLTILYCLRKQCGSCLLTMRILHLLCTIAFTCDDSIFL